MDFKKAFDLVNHEILLTKLKPYQLSSYTLNWFRSYLTDRKQQVQVGNDCSDYESVINGVPQGSILGPLLFIIYINDISQASKLFHLIIYADDTTIYSTLNTFQTNNTENLNINDELEKISNWLKANRLSLNVSKSKYMVNHKEIT